MQHIVTKHLHKLSKHLHKFTYTSMHINQNEVENSILKKLINDFATEEILI